MSNYFSFLDLSISAEALQVTNQKSLSFKKEYKVILIKVLSGKMIKDI